MSDGLADLQALRDLVDERKAAMAAFDARERDLVKSAREQSVGGYYSYRSVPWEDIAQALGISRQAVMKRHAAALEAMAKDENGRDIYWSPHRRRYDAGRPRDRAK